MYVADKNLLWALEGIDLAEVSITSEARLIAKSPPDGAFTLPDVPGVGVVPKRAEGQQVFPLVAHPDRHRRRPRISRPVARDAAAVREFDARAKAAAKVLLRRWIWGPYSDWVCSSSSDAGLDQAHKWSMLNVYDIADRGRVTVTPFLDLVFVKNTGISYSMFDQESYGGQIMLASFGLVATALWVWLARAATGRLLAISSGSSWAGRSAMPSTG